MFGEKGFKFDSSKPEPEVRKVLPSKILKPQKCSEVN